jgi:hypothetical protein
MDLEHHVYDLFQPEKSEKELPSRLEEKSWCVGFEVLTAVVMKCSVFWHITPCIPLKVDRCCRGTWFLAQLILQP